MKNKIPANTYLSSFCMELSMLTGAGVSPYDSVMTLFEDELNKDSKSLLQNLLCNLDKGMTFSSSLRESGYFPHHMANMIEAGEKTGRLVETLKALSEHYDRQERLLASVKSAVVYPVVLLIMMVAVVLILIVRVLPIFNDVYGRLGSQMPPFAMGLMRFGKLLGNISAGLAAAVGLVIVAAIVIWMLPVTRKAVKNAIKNTLGDRGIFWKLTVSRFISVMATATAGGIDPESAAELAAMAAGGSKAATAKFETCIGRLRAGETLVEAMFGIGMLSARDSRMLATGSRTGMADVAMAEIAERNERNAQDELSGMVGKIEPTLVITASIVVGIILLTVMLPLMGIMTSIG